MPQRYHAMLPLDDRPSINNLRIMTLAELKPRYIREADFRGFFRGALSGVSPFRGRGSNPDNIKNPPSVAIWHTEAVILHRRPPSRQHFPLKNVVKHNLELEKKSAEWAFFKKNY